MPWCMTLNTIGLLKLLLINAIPWICAAVLDTCCSAILLRTIAYLGLLDLQMQAQPLQIGSAHHAWISSLCLSRCIDFLEPLRITLHPYKPYNPKLHGLQAGNRHGTLRTQSCDVPWDRMFDICVYELRDCTTVNYSSNGRHYQEECFSGEQVLFEAYNQNMFDIDYSTVSPVIMKFMEAPLKYIYINIPSCAVPPYNACCHMCSAEFAACPADRFFFSCSHT